MASMRIVAWNCCMALNRKFEAISRLEPDVAVICECAEPRRLAAVGALKGVCAEPVWIGDNGNKGLAVFTYSGYRARLAEPFYPGLRHIAPVTISGSAYHELRGEAQGSESVPTLYWRDRKKTGPCYHIDYIFL